MYITPQIIAEYERRLMSAEREPATVSQYMRCIHRLAAWLGGRAATKELLHEYKGQLKASAAPATVNTAVAAINGFFACFDRHDLRMKLLKRQKKIFTSPEREMCADERDRLLDTAKRLGRMRLYYIIKTLSVTGIRISELKYVTVEAVKSEIMEISCKGKYRVVMLHPKLCRELLAYAKEMNIEKGSIFITRGGKPVDRSNTAKEMKRLAEIADVLKKKVFPHNFRHLFARTFYNATKDIVKLADILGHSSINTTRIYTMESGAAHRQRLTEIFQI